MEYPMEGPAQCVCSAADGQNVAIGFLDGSVQFGSFTNGGFDPQWKFTTKSSIRGVAYNEEAEEVYAIGRNKSVNVFDARTGKRKRCVLKCHDDIPSTLCVLPPTSLHNQQAATGDESGQVVNALASDEKHNLLSASSDAKLAAYDVRKKKLRVKSETMHSELNSICVTQQYVYVGAGDGYVEVFTVGEYGNLLQRVESGHDMVVDGIVELRSGLLLTSSFSSNKLRLLNVMPSKKLGVMGVHGEGEDGIDAIAISADRSTLLTLVALEESVKRWSLDAIVAKIPILRSVDASKRKEKAGDGFFDDLADVDGAAKSTTSKKKKRRKNHSD